MSFIDADERIIIMDISPPVYVGGEHDYSLSADDMKRLREVGIRTVLQPMWWIIIEKEPGVRNWEPIELGLRKAEEAGMKVLLGCYQAPPQCMPEDWYYKFSEKEGGAKFPHFSIWNEEANAYEEEFVRELASRYASDTVLIQNTLISDGETLLSPHPCWYDKAALASFKEQYGNMEPNLKHVRSTGWLRDSIIEKMKQYQALLLEVQDHDEIWFQLHPHIKPVPAGTQYMPELFAAMRAEWPSIAIRWLLYTFYEFPKGWRDNQIDLAKAHNVDLVVGAQHCNGLPKTVPLAREDNVDLLCGPRHNCLMPELKNLEPWMVERLAWAVKELSC